MINFEKKGFTNYCSLTFQDDLMLHCLYLQHHKILVLQYIGNLFHVEMTLTIMKFRFMKRMLGVKTKHIEQVTEQ